MAAASLQRMDSRHARPTAATAPASSPGARPGFGRRGPIISTFTSRSPLLSRRGRMVMVDGLGGAHWVLIQYARLCVPGDLGGGARARDHDRDLVGELLDLARVVQEVVWVDAQEDHERGCEGAGDVGDGADRAVGAEVGDPPAAAAQGDPEGQQAEFVLFAGYAGQNGARTLALAPALGEPEEASPDRKSTRLNSSHQIISYAVFCLKKKKKKYKLNYLKKKNKHHNKKKS